MYGYIYVRDQRDYVINDVYKVGKTIHLLERNNTYKTGEVSKGFYLKIYRFGESVIDKIEKSLQIYLKKKDLYYPTDNGGLEFFKRTCLPYIDKFFENIGVEYHQLTQSEMDEINWANKNYHNENSELDEDDDIYQYDSDDEDNKLSETLIKVMPRDDQLEIIEKSVEHFNLNKKGLLVLICGIGKTLISLWISERMNSKHILIGVPNLELLNQWKKEIEKVFPNADILSVCSGIGLEDITNFLTKKTLLKKVLITTYSSAHKVLDATKKINFTFDFCINDETHHLTTSNFEVANEKQSFIKMLQIDSNNTLSLTATLKTIDETITNPESTISNDNKEVFGEIIASRNLFWGIQHNIICDYEIQTLLCNINQLYNLCKRLGIENEFRFMINYSESNQENVFDEDENEEVNNFRFFLSAFISLKSISEGQCNHLLIYTNKSSNAEKVIEYIRFFLKKKCFPHLNLDLFVSSYLGHYDSSEKNKRLGSFTNSPYGILSCVYCLGEGWNCPILHGVVFAENMSSNIRIVQSALRPCRKSNDIPNKLAKIIIPVLNTNGWLDCLENVDFRKVREIIYQMGLEDQTVCQKIKAYMLKIDSTIQTGFDKNSQQKNIGEFNEQITNELKIKAIPRDRLGYSYEKARTIIKEYNLKSIEEYYDLCQKNIYLPMNPETVYENKFTNWVHYLTIGNVYYDLSACIEKIGKYINLSNISNECLLEKISTLNGLDNKFPPRNLWKDYYKLSDLMEFAKKINIRRQRVVF